MQNLRLALNQSGLSAQKAEKLVDYVKQLLTTLSPEKCWQQLLQEHILSKYPFPIQLALYKTIYPDWEKTPAPVWFPDEKLCSNTNLAKLMLEKGYKNYLRDYFNFHEWSWTHHADFWRKMASLMNIQFDSPYTDILDTTTGIETPHWFAGAKLNITNSLFQAKKTAFAIISQTEQGKITKTTYEELDHLSNRIANSLSSYLKKGDRAAIIMPMTKEAVAIFIGIIKAGGVVVAIPDSFSAKEMALRLSITHTALVFCQDQIIRHEKIITLYERILQANSPRTVVIPAETQLTVKLRNQDLAWDQFLVSEENIYPYVVCDPHDPINILFSSGTTGTPKAIPWNHITPIKCASDAYLHHNLQANDVFCWPSNLGWMMGPWLIFACLLNKATLALYSGAPYGNAFGKFIHHAKVTHLGVVPTMVKYWRTTKCMEGLHWKTIKLLTSTGERSNIDDMLYLMSLVEYKPIIEYCGGTEIAGAYITATLLQPCAPAAFTTAAMGLDFVILDENGKLADQGEVALIPPAIGLSTELLNQSNHQVYYANMPSISKAKVLRRHGDQIQACRHHYYRLLGRVDDVIKLGGIKVSSAEIENCILNLPFIYDTAAVGIDTEDGGPTQLIAYVVLKKNIEINTSKLKETIQQEIKQHLNPLFKLDEVIIVEALPRTASNKVLRRVLREMYVKGIS